ncbi:MAG: hypothetical protein WAK55_17410 [Xanthobacteraceae bacterium]
MPITHPNTDRVAAITIDVIPHHLQRYDTCGDYTYDAYEKTLAITVSATDDWREAMTVAVHELVEALLVIQRGIPVAAIDSFDRGFSGGDQDEPGDAPDAPYYDEHQSATVVEYLMAHELGLHWPSYEEHIYALSDTYTTNPA